MTRRTENDRLPSYGKAREAVREALTQISDLGAVRDQQGEVGALADGDLVQAHAYFTELHCLLSSRAWEISGDIFRRLGEAAADELARRKRDAEPAAQKGTRR